MAFSAITNPTSHFNTKLYTGNNSSTALTGVGFQPDWLWFKRRDSAAQHSAFDSVRGLTKQLTPNGTDAQQTISDALTSFDSDGFTLGADSGNYINYNSATYLAWCWKAGTTGSGTTGGSGTSKAYSYSVNTTAGFGIVKYVGNGTNNHQIPHHLGAVPQMLMFKNEQSGYAWDFYHHLGTGNNYRMYHNSTDASASATNYLYSTTPTSTYINLGDAGHTNHNGTEHIVYCFAPKPGFSAFGTYTGNGNADGPFIYTGFKPARLMIKRTDAANNWKYTDSKRNPSNIVNKTINGDTTGAEGTEDHVDYLCNGFKVRRTGNDINNNGGHYCYAAWAEEPMVSNVGSNGIPATAR
mgnify:FL=1